MAGTQILAREYNGRDAAKHRRAERRWRNHLENEPPERPPMKAPTEEQKQAAINYLTDQLEAIANTTDSAANNDEEVKQEEARAAQQIKNLLTAWDNIPDELHSGYTWFKAREVQRYCNTVDFVQTETEWHQPHNQGTAISHGHGMVREGRWSDEHTHTGRHTQVVPHLSFTAACWD